MNSFGDEIAAQLDKRKIEKLVDDGAITPEDIANAPIYVECPKCLFEADAELDVCPECGYDYE